MSVPGPDAGARTTLYFGLLLLATLAVVLVLGISVLSLRTADRLAESVASVSHTQRVLEQINRFWGVLGDRDSELLRYLLTGNRRNLDEFQQSLLELKRSNAQLELLVHDNPAQRALLEEIDALHRQRLRRAQELIALKQRAEQGDPQARALLDLEFDQSPGTGNAEAMRKALERMAGNEKSLLARRSEQRTQMILQNRRAVLAANALALLAGGAVLLTVRRLRRRADEVLKARLQAEQAQRADREKSALLATQQRLAQERQLGMDLIAHDLRQHFGNILFGLDLLREAEAPDARDRLIRTARGAANSGLLFLEAVLEQSADEARGEAVGPVAIADVVRAAVAAHGHQVQAKRMRVDLRLDPGLRVRAQASALGHVVANLVSNAVKYAPADSTVEVESQAGADRACLRVLDRGPGVPAAEQASLFRRFAPLSPQPSGGEATTGLGLALARQRARAQGGELRYEDRPGGGACFVLEWPLA